MVDLSFFEEDFSSLTTKLIELVPHQKRVALWDVLEVRQPQMRLHICDALVARSFYFHKTAQQGQLIQCNDTIAKSPNVSSLLKN